MCGELVRGEQTVPALKRLVSAFLHHQLNRLSLGCIPTTPEYSPLPTLFSPLPETIKSNTEQYEDVGVNNTNIASLKLNPVENLPISLSSKLASSTASTTIRPSPALESFFLNHVLYGCSRTVVGGDALFLIETAYGGDDVFSTPSTAVLSQTEAADICIDITPDGSEIKIQFVTRYRLFQNLIEKNEEGRGSKRHGNTSSQSRVLVDMQARCCSVVTLKHVEGLVEERAGVERHGVMEVSPINHFNDSIRRSRGFITSEEEREESLLAVLFLSEKQFYSRSISIQPLISPSHFDAIIK